MPRPKKGTNLTTPEEKTHLNDPLIQTWINEFSNYNTRRHYQKRISIFFAITKTKPDDLQKMDNKEIKNLLLTFQREYKEKHQMSNNQVIAIINAVRSYMTSLERKITFRRSQIINQQADINSHVFTNGDLRLMFEVGGAFEKALLATACSQGWEISMFLEQKRDKIERRIAHANQNGMKYIFFMDTREKTGQPRLCVLNPLAIEYITKYLSVRTDDDPRLFPITTDGVQKMLYRLAKDANLKTFGNLRFHNIRKWLMSRLSRCNFNSFQIKYIMGKSIGISDLVYLQTLQTEIEEKYPIVYNDYLNICWTPQVTGGAVFSAEEVEMLKALLTAAKAGKIQFKK